MAYQGIEVAIEVTVKEGDTSKQRGDLLEALAKRVLLSLQHQHVKTEIRVTGCELDLIASEKQTGKKIIVECKAYRDRTISADVVTKMLGNLMLHDYDSAWLITTSRLGKDASGAVDKIRSQPTKSQSLRVYEPLELVELLSSTGQVSAPDTLKIPAGIVALPQRTLLLTDIGEFWAITAVGERSGVADTVVVFDAKSGARVTNEPIVQQLSERDSNLRELSWVAGEEQIAAASAIRDAALKSELDNIAPVPVADDWSDYRPARPKDFVGRDGLQKSITEFLEDVARGRSETRLLAIKAPSGWGKSSFLIKLKSVCASPRLRDSVFMYSVDCRTASSPRYPELALKKCLDEAVAGGFVSSPLGSCRITSPGDPFSDPTARALLDELRAKDKVVVLFFDQFEEITTKQELSDLFVQVKALCAALESSRENVVLGFSWKTDGTIPTDHPAYHVWHSFADRRREFELPLFSKQDTSRLLSGLSRELKKPIEPWLRRLLAEHSQGYPWLLKKLCIHVFRVLQTQPARQRELFERALDAEALFKKDLADLDASQIACLENIARESPADNFRIMERFGDKTVDALIQRRLVLRNAGKLIVYWDIFRDYVLTKQVPAIPTRYVPVSSPATVKRTMEVLSSGSNFYQISVIAKKLNIQNGTLDNVARDLVMMGVCQYDRRNSKFRLLHSKPKHSLLAMFRFFASHAFMRVLVDQFGSGFKSVSFAQVEAELVPKFDSGDYAKTTIHASIVRWLSWLQALGIVSSGVDGSITHNSVQAPLTEFDELRLEQRSHRGVRVFRGEGQPLKVLEVLHALVSGGYEAEAEDRNALYVLRSLRIIPSTVQPVLLEKPPAENRDLWLALKVFNQSSIRAARAVLASNPEASFSEIGGVLETLGHTGLSEGSKRRYGNSLALWINWMRNYLKD